MDRVELGKELNMREEIIPLGAINRRELVRISPTTVTIHNTDNRARGAGAARHSRFVREVGYYTLRDVKHPVSWHFVVDDMMVIKQLPIDERALHAGRGNRSSIAIEICMNEDIDQDAANERAAKLVAVLLYDLGLKTTEIRTHKDWTGKNCPSLLLPSMPKFIERVGVILDSITGPKGGLEFDAIELNIATDLDTDIDHSALNEAMNAASFNLFSPLSGSQRIERALELVREGAVYPGGCSGFVARVLQISPETANALMGQNPASLGSRPPYPGLSLGDVVGWKSQSGSGHVAFYYGRSSAEYFIDVADVNQRPRIKNGFYDREIFKSSRF